MVSGERYFYFLFGTRNACCRFGFANGSQNPYEVLASNDVLADLANSPCTCSTKVSISQLYFLFFIM